MPLSEALDGRAGHPKRVVLMPGASHYAVYSGPPFEEVMHHKIAWLGE